MPLIIKEKVKEWKRHITSQNGVSQQVLLGIASYSGVREGFVKQISPLEDFLEILIGAHDVHCESPKAKSIVQTLLTTVCFWEAHYGISLPLNVVGKCWLK